MIKAAPQGTPKPKPPGTPTSNVTTNGQAVNTGSLLSGLTAESQVKPDTGTATGDQAVRDRAKANLYKNQADMRYGLDMQNAKTNTARVQQGEQMAQAWSQAQMAQYQTLSRQRSQQTSLAQKLLEERIGMQNQWQTSLIGMMS
jgi:hypothetical protein